MPWGSPLPRWGQGAEAAVAAPELGDGRGEVVPVEIGPHARGEEEARRTRTPTAGSRSGAARRRCGPAGPRRARAAAVGLAERAREALARQAVAAGQARPRAGSRRARSSRRRRGGAGASARAVSASAAAIAVTSAEGRRSRRPITDRRTPFSAAAPLRRAGSARTAASGPCTSSAAAPVVGGEGEEGQRADPTPGAASTTRRTASRPRGGRPSAGARGRAQRPLPSMITATWRPACRMTKYFALKVCRAKKSGRQRSRVARMSASMWSRYRSSARRPTG